MGELRNEVEIWNVMIFCKMETFEIALCNGLCIVLLMNEIKLVIVCIWLLGDQNLLNTDELYKVFIC